MQRQTTSTVIDLTDDQVSKLLRESYYSDAQSRTLSLAEANPVAAAAAEAGSQRKTTPFEGKVNALITEQKKTKPLPFTIRMVINTKTEQALVPDEGTSAHWAVIEFEVTEDTANINGHKITNMNWVDSLEVSPDTKNTSKEKIIAGLGSLIDSDSPPKLAVDPNSPKQTDRNSCGYYALMNLVDRTTSNPASSAATEENLKAYIKTIATSKYANENDRIEVLVAACIKFAPALYKAPASPAAPAAASTPPPAASPTPPAASPAPSAKTETDKEHINDVFEGINTNRLNLPNFDDDAKLTERTNVFIGFLECRSKEQLETFNRALLASINLYVELKLSAQTDDKKKDQLSTLETKINDLSKQLHDAKETLETLQNHLDEINPSRKKSLGAELTSKLTIVNNALDKIPTFEEAKKLSSGLLHASILAESEATTHDSYDNAKSEAGKLLGTPDIVNAGYLVNGEESKFKTTENKQYTVFKMSVTAQDGTTINAATIRIVDTTSAHVKSEYHFRKDELEALKNKENINSPIIELVAQKIKNHRAALPDVLINEPMKLNIGKPPMPEEMIKAHIIYCEFKGYPLQVPAEYKKYQEEVNKPTRWFNKEGRVDSFARAWKISHPDDVGIKEQQKVDAELQAPAGRSGPSV